MPESQWRIVNRRERYAWNLGLLRPLGELALLRFYSKLLEETCVNMNASESKDVGKGHVATFCRFQQIRRQRFV